MKIYTIHYIKKNLKTDYKVTDITYSVATENLALELFRMLVEELRRRHLNEAVSIHECVGIDPCDFEYNDSYTTFELVTNQYKFEVDVYFEDVFESVDEVCQHCTVFGCINNPDNPDDSDDSDWLDFRE